MLDLQLNIFPEDTVATSITTMVLVGVWVVVFLNLRFGWILSGLVVPGYLAPLLIAKPVSAMVIVVESVLTYGIVWSLSESCRQGSYWSSFFGRDRFFAFVLVSILVRIFMDGWLLPTIGPHVEQLLGGGFDHRNHLHSYGLIIVSLIANYFWKSGVRNGLGALSVTVGVTYLIVRYVLIEFTNLNVGNLQYMYEDVASSLLASPKSYIILVTTAFVASWMNLRYSWDYNGILVPSLLALQWHNPYKIGASFLEAVVILLLAQLVLKLPIWRRTTMEGGRKILLFFSLAYVYRLALGHIVPILMPDIKVSDAFGFGYLLSTMLAIRAYEKKLLIRVTRASVQVSLLGAVAGSFVGFALMFLPSFTASSLPADSSIPQGGASSSDLVSLLRQDQLAFYQQRLPGSFQPPTGAELSDFQRGLKCAAAYARERQPYALAAARSAFVRVRYELLIVQGRYLYAREQRPMRGRGLYVWDLESPDGAVIETPAPLDEWSTMEAGLCLFRRLGGSAFAVAGTSRLTNRDGSADVLANPLLFYGVFHREFARGNVLEVRALSPRHLRAQASEMPGGDDNSPSSLWVCRGIPEGCRLDSIRELLTSWRLYWRKSPMPNVHRDNTRGAFAELALSHRDRRRLQASLLVSEAATAGQLTVPVLKQPLRTWLLDQKEQIARRGSDEYRRPTVAEMLYFDEQVLRPLFRLLRSANSLSQLSPASREELKAVAAAAAVVNYRLTVFIDQPGGSDLLGLSETDEPPRRHWGAYAFRFGLRGEHLLEAPRPLYERSVLEASLALFDRVPAVGLLTAGAHPLANRDGSADVILMRNKVSLFQLVHQVLNREAGDRPLLTASVRAIRAPVETDVVVALDEGGRSREQATPLQQNLLDALHGTALRYKIADGSPATAGYEVGISPQLQALAHSRHKEFVALWLSPTARLAFQRAGEDDTQAAQFSTLQIPSLVTDLGKHLTQTAGNARQQVALPAGLRELVDDYLRARDIVLLRKIQFEFPEFRIRRLIDRTSQHAFLEFSVRVTNQYSHRALDGELAAATRLPALVSLAERTGHERPLRVKLPLQEKDVRRFILSRATWLQAETER